MPPKRGKASASDCKRQRRSISLEMKQNVIKQHEGGKSVNAIARDLGMSHSTITTILKNKEKILQAVKRSTPLRATRLIKMREGPISDMEALLMTWIEDQTQKQIPISTLMIIAKARSLFEMLKKKAGPDYDIEFSASSGWLKRFKQRCLMHNNVQAGDESVSADTQAVEEFVETLDKLIVEGGYLPHHIFNMDEISLFWKLMPEWSFTHEEAKSMPVLKAFKDRVTVLLGGNAAGYKLKPLVIWHSENPRAFKTVNKHTLPVYYRADKKSWMTQALFQDALLNCYASEMEKYCLEEGVPFKILLILDNAPGHPPFIGDLHPNIKVVFLPPNITSLIQPTDQGAIAAFKAYYLRRIFAQAIAATEETGESLMQFWEQYNIYHCVKNLAWAWDNVTKDCMNAIWKKILKRYIHDFKGFEKDDEIARINRGIVDMVNNNLNLNIDDEDIEELLEVVPEELTYEELMEQEQERMAEEEAKDIKVAKGEEEEAQKRFTVNGLAKLFAELNSLLKSAEEMDPNSERFSLIERNAHAVFAPYKEIYEEKKKQTRQTTLDIFMKQPTSPKEESPEPRSSGVIGNNVVFVSDGSSVTNSDADDADPLC